MRVAFFLPDGVERVKIGGTAEIISSYAFYLVKGIGLFYYTFIRYYLLICHLERGVRG